MSNPFSDFLKYAEGDNPFRQWLMPIMPAGAKRKHDATGEPGKNPGKWLAHVDGGIWVNMKNWPNMRAGRAAMELWQDWQLETGPIAIGLNNRDFPCIDIDANSARFADLAERVFIKHCGQPLAIRRRKGNDTRRVLVYEHNQHTAPLHKRVLTMKEDEGDTEITHTVELQAHGQQTVIEGPHKSGAMHYWQDGRSLIDAWKAGDVGNYDGAEHEAAMLDGNKVEAALRELEELATVCGYERVKLSPFTARQQRDDFAIDDVLSPNFTADRPLLEKAVGAIDLDHDQFDYDRFITLLRAIKAACGGEQDFLETVVWPWVCTQQVARGEGPRTQDQPGGGLEWLQDKWESFHDSSIGADWIFALARSFGCEEAAQHLAQSAIEEAFGAPVDEQPMGEADGEGDGGGSAEAPGGGAGGGGPLSTPDTHAAIVEHLEAAFAERWRYATDSKTWYGYAAGRWQEEHGIQDDVKTYCCTLAQTILATVTSADAVKRSDRLKDMRTWSMIKRALEGGRRLTLRETQFDRDHDVLNTPSGVWDLRFGTVQPHSPHFLMKHMTRYAPDPDILNLAVCEGDSFDWARVCPKWMQLVRTLANGRDFFETFLQREYGIAFSGRRRHSHLLFVEGGKGTGKSQLVLVILKLADTYGMALPDRFVKKTNGDKRFELSQIIGKRVLVIDETQQGSTYDETLLCSVATAPTLTAEFKNGKVGVEFVNTASLLMAGNNRPRWVAGEVGGLVDRMLLLEITSEKFRNTAKEIHDLAQVITEEEGPAVMAWALRGAMLDYADTDMSQYRALVEPMLEASRQDAAEQSPVRQWGEAMQLVEAPDLKMETMASYNGFLSWFYATTHRHNNMSLDDWKKAVKEAWPSVFFSKIKTHARPNIAGLFGLGQRVAFPVEDAEG